MKENPTFYAVLPANIRYAEDLSSLQKLLYAEITCLTDKMGYCFATNSYFENLYHKDKIRVSKQIVDMEKKGYLKIEVDKEKGNVRKIFIGEIKKLKKEITTVKKPIVEKEDTYRGKVGEGIVEKEYTPIVEKDNHYRRKRQP